VHVFSADELACQVKENCAESGWVAEEVKQQTGPYKIEDFLSQALPDDKIGRKTFAAISAWGLFCIG
jgi:hypothetical protein